jgi:hypothetical protein
MIIKDSMISPPFASEVQRMRQPSRRTFLKYGLGACSAGALIRPLSAQSRSMPYYKAVFDDRFEDARAFAAEARARAIPTAAIRGDVTSLFFNDLDLRWKLDPVWLIGFTTPASLFCLHLLARDRGMRLRFCRAQPNRNAVRGVLDGALPRDRIRTHLPSSDSAELVFWIIAPSARASAKEIVNA